MGKAKMMRMLVSSAVQVNSGIRMSFMPGARILMMVTRKLMPVRSVPTPDIWMDHSQ